MKRLIALLVTALALLGLLPPGAACTGRICLDGQEVVGASQATLRRLRGGVAAGADVIQRVGQIAVGGITAHVDGAPGTQRGDVRP